MFVAIFLIAALVSVSNAYLPVRPFAVRPAPLPSAGRIVGGEETNIKEFPYQVALLNEGEFSCGGSIVKPKAMVTAAHCTRIFFVVIPPSAISIRAGSSKHNFGGQVIQCSHYFVHELHSTLTLDNDIAILALSSSIHYSELAAPIALATQGLVVPDGTAALTTGWGTQVLGEEASPDVLHKIEIPIVNQNLCVEAFKKNIRPITITPRMICAGLLGEGGKSPCHGDSGGPLVVDNTLVGVTSIVYLCGSPEYPGAWARISEHRNWIDDKLSQIV